MNYNSENEIKLRRHRNNLAGCGSGFILFGLWSAIKTFMQTMFDKTVLKEIKDATEISSEDMFFFNIIVVIILFIIAAFVILLHLYIGAGAIRYSKGKEKKGFLVLAAITFLAILCMMPSYFNSAKEGLEHIDTIIVSAAADIMVLFILADMFYSVTQIKKLTASGTKEDGDAG
ncbi:MAG: hypothetical protein K6F73_03955 [Lachnospiraceae bacterium]|nr:hypothetical protein [Lachnospiraceae bacterium]